MKEGIHFGHPNPKRSCQKCDGYCKKNVYKKESDESFEVRCISLACMEPNLQKQFEDSCR
jgi:hypothetical protein